MSSIESALVPTNPRRRILWLVVAHTVVGLIGMCFAARFPSLRAAAFFGIVNSQASLLGIWGSLGSGPWCWRLTGVVVGVGYLCLLLEAGISESSVAMFLLLAPSTTFVMMPLLIVRFLRVGVRPDSSLVTSKGRIQFSIRHLMILTFVVACLTTIGKWVQPDIPQGVMFFRWLSIIVTFGLVGVLPVWFVLATKQPMLFGVVLVAVAACAGYCLGWILYEFGFGIVATTTQATAVVASLLIVRSCGYRLVRLGPSSTADQSAKANAC